MPNVSPNPIIAEELVMLQMVITGLRSGGFNLCIIVADCYTIPTTIGDALIEIKLEAVGIRFPYLGTIKPAIAGVPDV